MGQFLGSHQNRLDAKGRVSIPAQFRATLKQLGRDGASPLILRQSHLHPCIEGWPEAEFNALSTPLQKLDVFSESQEDLSWVLYADACPVEPDREGRVVLPAALVAHAGLENADTVVFMGLGRTFQIWEPAAAARRSAEARERARARGFTVPGVA